MKEIYRRPEPEMSDREPKIREAWARADRLLKNRRPEILERVRTDADRFFGTERNSLYGLRTLASAIELGIVSSPPDAETAANITRALHHTDDIILEAFGSDEARKILTGLGIYRDRLTVDHWIGKEERKEPLIAEGTRKKVSSAAVRSVSGSGSDHAEGVRYAAILSRAGLLTQIPDAERESLLDRIDRYLPDAARRGTEMLERELEEKDGVRNPGDAAPHAAYGLFLLSDVRTLTEHRNGENA